jgi:hypothetical protein
VALSGTSRAPLEVGVSEQYELVCTIKLSASCTNTSVVRHRDLPLASSGGRSDAVERGGPFFAVWFQLLQPDFGPAD